MTTMSGSISGEEDWAIILSLSDFEDESTTSSLLGQESDAENPPAPSVDELVDESTVTIRASEGVVAPVAAPPVLALKEAPAPETEPATDLASDPESVPLVAETVPEAPTASKTCLARADSLIRRWSAHAYDRVFGARLALLRALLHQHVASGVSLTWFQHTVYSVLVALESQRELLLYYALATAAATAACTSVAMYLGSTPPPKVSALDSWIDSARLFVVHEPKLEEKRTYWPGLRQWLYAAPEPEPSVPTLWDTTLAQLAHARKYGADAYGKVAAETAPALLWCKGEVDRMSVQAYRVSHDLSANLRALWVSGSLYVETLSEETLLPLSRRTADEVARWWAHSVEVSHAYLDEARPYAAKGSARIQELYAESAHAARDAWASLHGYVELGQAMERAKVSGRYLRDAATSMWHACDTASQQAARSEPVQQLVAHARRGAEALAQQWAQAVPYTWPQ